MSLIATTLATASFAIVTADNSALRASPKESAAQHAVLSQGDMLEIRSRNLDYFGVYDYRRERAGFVKASLVRQTATAPQDAVELLATLRHLRDTQGSDALGVALFANYAKIAPATALNAEAFDMLGIFAERIAQRVNRAVKSDEVTAMRQLETAAYYGVKMKSFDANGRVRFCYDGEAHRRVLALTGADSKATTSIAAAQQRARAALALTNPACIDPNEHPANRRALEQWRLEVIQQIEITQLPDYLQSRISLRRAAVASGVSFYAARASEPANLKAKTALDEFTRVDRTKVAEEDISAYEETAIRVGVIRGLPASPKSVLSKASGIRLRTRPAEPGQTCVQVVDADDKALAERCTYGVVHLDAASIDPRGKAVALAVQPPDGWRELWVFQKDRDSWRVDVLPPSTNAREIGYIDFAGWVPGGQHVLIAREYREEHRFKKSFELMKLDSLTIEKRADSPEKIVAFQRWQDLAWSATTVAVR